MKRLSMVLLNGSLLAAMLLLDATPIQAAAIEEVIVTARKREESLQDVPIAISMARTERGLTGQLNGDALYVLP